MKKPVNGHILIEPVKQEAFMSSAQQTYQEVGKVISRDLHLTGVVEPGDMVYFDAWLAAKYPNPTDPDGFYWLVKWEDVRMIDDHAES